jgi:hypothetical protein
MVKGTSQKTANGSALDFKAQLWAAAEQAVPASNCRRTEYNGARPEGLCLGLIIRHITLACSGAVSAPDSNSTAVTDRRYNHRKDVLGRVYEYEKFASAEGKGGGEFYTPQCVVQVLVAMLEPYKGRMFETLQWANSNFFKNDKSQSAYHRCGAIYLSI